MTPAQKDAWDLDEATVQMIEDRFYYREICDDERMVRYFQRTLDTVRDRYRDILRIETIKFDPLVSRYFEGEFTSNGSEDVQKTGRKSGNANTTVVHENDETHGEHTDNDLSVTRDEDHYEGSYQDDITHDSDGHDTRNGNNTVAGTTRSQHNVYTSSRTDSHSENDVTNDGTNDGISRGAIKQAPMNASGVSLNGKEVSEMKGMLTGLDFSYASSYNQGDSSGKSHSHTDDDTTSNSTITGSDNGTSQDITSNTHVINEGVSRHDEGEDHQHHAYDDDHTHFYNDARDITVDGSSHNEGSTVTTQTNGGSTNEMSAASRYQVRHDRYTGRDNVLPQDALKAAMNYLQNYSNAFEWLCNKLEINFIGIYDI